MKVFSQQMLPRITIAWFFEQRLYTRYSIRLLQAAAAATRQHQAIELLPDASLGEDYLSQHTLPLISPCNAPHVVSDQAVGQARSHISCSV